MTELTKGERFRENAKAFNNFPERRLSKEEIKVAEKVYYEILKDCEDASNTGNFLLKIFDTNGVYDGAFNTNKDVLKYVMKLLNNQDIKAQIETIRNDKIVGITFEW